MSKQTWFIEIITDNDEKNIKQLQKLTGNMVHKEQTKIHLGAYTKYKYHCDNIYEIYKLQSRLENKYPCLFVHKIGMIYADPTIGIKEKVMTYKSIYSINEKREYNDDSNYVMDAIMVTNLRYQNDNKQSILE